MSYTGFVHLILISEVRKYTIQNSAAHCSQLLPITQLIPKLKTKSTEVKIQILCGHCSVLCVTKEGFRINLKWEKREKVLTTDETHINVSRPYLFHSCSLCILTTRVSGCDQARPLSASPPAFTCSSKNIFGRSHLRWHSLSALEVLWGSEALKQPQLLWQGKPLLSELSHYSKQQELDRLGHTQIPVAQGGMGMEGGQSTKCFSHCSLLMPLTAPERFADKFWADRFAANDFSQLWISGMARGWHSPWRTNKSLVHSWKFSSSKLIKMWCSKLTQHQCSVFSLLWPWMVVICLLGVFW